MRIQLLDRIIKLGKLKIVITLCYFILFFVCLSTFLNAQTLNIPSRPSNALTGSEFVTVITDMPLTERENNIYDQIALGNIPDFYRTLCPVSITENIGGTDRTATFYVSADYLAIGSNDDYFLCPMTPVIAQEVVELLDCTMDMIIEGLKIRRSEDKRR